MKKQIAITVALLAAAIAAGQCYAQQTSLKGDIPFAFQVGNTTMPAGEYVIQRGLVDDGSLQLIRRTDSSASAIAPTIPVDAKGGESEPVLVFHKYGNSYFLSEIWTGEAQGRQLFKSEREKELARESRGSEVAVSLRSVLERGL
jgi:hypothetical protein